MVTKLRQVLDERGVKLQWLTDKTGINYYRIRAMTKFGKEPYFSEAVLIGAVLEKDPAELFEIKEFHETQAA
jgi:hypothetical protein